MWHFAQVSQIALSSSMVKTSWRTDNHEQTSSMTCTHKTDVKTVDFSTAHHPREGVLVLISTCGIVQKDGETVDPRVFI